MNSNQRIILEVMKREKQHDNDINELIKEVDNKEEFINELLTELQNSEDETNRLRKQRKWKYIVGAGSCILLGVGIFVGRKSDVLLDSIKTIQINIGYKNVSIIRADLSRRMHPGYLVQILEDGPFKSIVYRSKNEAAEKMNVTIPTLNKMIENGAAKVVGEAH